MRNFQQDHSIKEIMIKNLVQKTGRCTILILLVLTVTILPSRTVETNVEHSSLFRYSGDGTLPIYNIHTKEFVEILYRDAQGNYDDESLRKIDEILACHYTNEPFTMSLKLIELVDHLQDHFGAERIEVISGYRSPEYNASLRRRNGRVARHSLHMIGRAVDLRLTGVNSQKIRNYAVSLHVGGVGYYGWSRPVHIDTGPVRVWRR